MIIRLCLFTGFGKIVSYGEDEERMYGLELFGRSFDEIEVFSLYLYLVDALRSSTTNGFASCKGGSH